MRRYPKKGGQFAIIWVDLLYEDSVPPSAKLLFGEIYRLSDADGWCDASNADFMDLLGCSENTVRNLLKSLEDIGQIRTVTAPKRDGKGGTSRRIFCGRKLAPPDIQEVPPKNCSTPKNLEGVPPKICEDTYFKSNKKSNTPIVPKDVLHTVEAYTGEDRELREAFDGFLANRAAIKKPVKTVRAVSRIINRLRAVNDRDVAIAMLDTPGCPAICWAKSARSSGRCGACWRGRSSLHSTGCAIGWTAGSGRNTTSENCFKSLRHKVRLFYKT